MIEKAYSFTRLGGTAEVYTLKNHGGMEARILTYGGRILSLAAPDRNGELSDVIVGYERAEDYLDKHPAYFGATVGRYCNRIGGGRFELGGREYKLTQNDGAHTLHGGAAGFDKKFMKARIDGDALELSFLSPDGEEGFPGNLAVTVRYSLTEDNELKIGYIAESDADTPISLTNHAYFNLGKRDDVLGHVLYINSSRITDADDDLIPHGGYVGIDGTPFSFKRPTRLGENMFSKEHMISLCHGFDFNYCIDRRTPHGLELCAAVYDGESGRLMECYTTLPGVQLYTSNTFAGTVGKKIYPDYAAVCLETQRYPNSPNCPNYPSCILKRGERYEETTVYKFSVR